MEHRVKAGLREWIARVRNVSPSRRTLANCVIHYFRIWNRRPRNGTSDRIVCCARVRRASGVILAFWRRGVVSMPLRSRCRAANRVAGPLAVGQEVRLWMTVCSTIALPG